MFARQRIGIFWRGVACGLIWALAAAAAASGLTETPEQTLARLIAEKKIVNVHEHIEDRAIGASLLESMDRTGVGKTVLMGSSRFTITLYERSGFTRYDENNDEILALAQGNPERFEAWPTLDPQDPEKLAKLERLAERGAKGIKLYLGHGYITQYSRRYMFHRVAMDDPGMLPVYQFCQERFLAVCLHVNPDMPGFADEFAAVLTQFPDLKVNAPHYFLSTIRESRLREFLTVFPNLNVDISFGHDEYLVAGLLRVSREPDRFRKLFADFPTRFMFGTDFVHTHWRPRSVEWVEARTRAYYDMLTKESYTTPLIPDRELSGLRLAPPVLENVLCKNYERFMESRPQGTVLPRALDWSRVRVRTFERKPGEALPPPQDGWWAY